MKTNLMVYVDGGSKRNGSPSQAAYGSFAVFYKDKLVKHKTRGFGSLTNNQAEYTAAIDALSYLYSVEQKNNDFPNHVIICSDSMLLVQQMHKKWKVNSDALKSYYKNAMRIIAGLNIKVTFQKVKRDKIVEILGH